MKVTDPVCGMTFEADKAAVTTDYNGTTYYFCAHVCRKQFGQDTARYASTE